MIITITTKWLPVPSIHLKSTAQNTWCANFPNNPSPRYMTPKPKKSWDSGTMTHHAMKYSLTRFNPHFFLGLLLDVLEKTLPAGPNSLKMDFWAAAFDSSFMLDSMTSCVGLPLWKSPGLCEGRDNRNCVVADKCIRNENGVWFCPPNKGRGGIRPPTGFEEMTHSNSKNQRK